MPAAVPMALLVLAAFALLAASSSKLLLVVLFGLLAFENEPILKLELRKFTIEFEERKLDLNDLVVVSLAVVSLWGLGAGVVVVGAFHEL